MDGSPLRLYVSVPVTCFRVPYAREYWETYPCPPPSTVYGMLLSVVGETDRLAHEGTEIALALLSEPARSVVLRTLWRVKNKKAGPGLGVNARPDFQELLTDVRLSVWIREGNGEKRADRPPLAERLRSAFVTRGGVRRFGGLALGESTHLVDEIRPWRQGDPPVGRLLVRAEAGSLTLPVWPDHVGAKGTRWGRFELERKAPLPDSPGENGWIVINPPS